MQLKEMSQGMQKVGEATKGWILRMCAARVEDRPSIQQVLEWMLREDLANYYNRDKLFPDLHDLRGSELRYRLGSSRMQIEGISDITRDRHITSELMMPIRVEEDQEGLGELFEMRQGLLVVVAFISEVHSIFKMLRQSPSECKTDRRFGEEDL